MVAKILVIDDEGQLAEQVRAAVSPDGHEVTAVACGPAALREVVQGQPDLVILGVCAADGGWPFFRRLAPLVETRLMLVLPAADPGGSAQALEWGADDCMAQPLVEVELAARARALLRRDRAVHPWRERGYYVDGDLVVDLARREVRLGDEPVALSSTEFLILSCLVQRAGDLLSVKEISRQVWGPNVVDATSALRSHIHHIRQAIELNPRRPRRIVTRWGAGYELRRIGPASS